MADGMYVVWLGQVRPGKQGTLGPSWSSPNFVAATLPHLYRLEHCQQFRDGRSQRFQAIETEMNGKRAAAIKFTAADGGGSLTRGWSALSNHDGLTTQAMGLCCTRRTRRLADHSSRPLTRPATDPLTNPPIYSKLVL
jgi:hypothetical protein